MGWKKTQQIEMFFKLLFFWCLQQRSLSFRYLHFHQTRRREKKKRKENEKQAKILWIVLFDVLWEKKIHFLFSRWTAFNFSINHLPFNRPFNPKQQNTLYNNKRQEKKENIISLSLHRLKAQLFILRTWSKLCTWFSYNFDIISVFQSASYGLLENRDRL